MELFGSFAFFGGALFGGLGLLLYRTLGLPWRLGYRHLIGALCLAVWLAVFWTRPYQPLGLLAVASAAMKESGFENFDVSSWFGLIAPAGTPPEVVNTLNAAMVKALDKPEVLQSYEKLGAVAQKTTPAEFGAFIKSEVEGWAPVVKASGATVD